MIELKNNFNGVRRNFMFLLFAFISFSIFSDAATKTSVTSGAWNVSSSWSPSGIPSSTDDVVIASGNVISITTDVSAKSVAVNSNATLNWGAQEKLTLNGDFIVNGNADLNNGNIQQLANGATFDIGASGQFIWNPNDNTQNGASLFLNSTENFSSTSTLVIKKWYSFSVPLGQIVTGSFGNVTISTIVGSTLFAWNQQNQFETHKILGTLTIDNGWVILDTTGTISNTQIGKIVLNNLNSFLDFHDGNHPSSFTVTTGSIVNTGGELNGIYNGNGNVTLNVTGNFTNLGNVELIYNTGVQGVGNGNAVLNVSGNYSQSAGDMRGIFNLSSTNCGTASLSFGSVTHTGGVMMAYYACNNSNTTCKINVVNDATINLSNANDKFRVNGLTTLWGHYSTAKSELTVGGNFSLSGLATAEFTSSGSVGGEIVNVGGNFSVNGLTNNFNFGSHASAITVGGKIIITGGTTCFSKTPGDLTTSITGDLQISGGTLALKGNTGKATATLNGNYIQTGGNFFLHNNSSVATSDVIAIIISGIFKQLNGILNFDDNSASAVSHSITLRGNQYIADGNGKITRAGAGSASVFGILNFATQGTIQYLHNTASHIIEQVKQIISQGCTVDISVGNFQLSSHANAANDFLTVQNGGTLACHLSQIISNAKAQNSGLTVDAGGKISTQNPYGFYNATNTACISSANNINFYLDESSIVEYNGTDNQEITGTSIGIATTANQQYGILKINFSGTPDAEFVKLNSSNVFVRKQLVLENGELNLNNNTITVESGNANAISRTNGYIKGDSPQSNVKWENISQGKYEFPFGSDSYTYIPVTLNISSGTSDATIGTWHCSQSNTPFPYGISSIQFSGKDISTTDVVDRWYYINASGIKADVTLSYAGVENTIAQGNQNSPLSVLVFENNKFRQINATGNGVTNGSAYVTVKNCNSFSYWVIADKQQIISSEFYFFNAVYQNGIVNASWIFDGEKTGDKYLIEVSDDNKSFKTLGSVNADGSYTYDFTDNNPKQRISYYRVKQISADGTYKYSESKQINTTGDENAQLDFVSVFPNPFQNNLSIDYYTGKSGTAKVNLINCTGQIVATQTQESQSGNNTIQLSGLNKLSNGIYIVSLNANGLHIAQKILKR